MQTKSSLLTIVIGLVTTPARAQWPAHGEVVLRDQATGTVLENLVFFSYEAGRQLVETIARMGLVDQATLTAACLELGRLALPTTLHRFDRLYRSFGAESGEKLVELFTGGLKPTSSNRNANFVICKDGRFCQSRSCRRYAAHGALVLGGRENASSKIVFSQTYHAVLLRNSVTSGLLTDVEFERLTSKTTGLEENEVTRQADLLVASAKNDEDCAQSLNLLFSERPDPRANDFAPCGGTFGSRHVHFAGALAQHKNSRPLMTMREVNEAIDELLACGGTTQAGAEAMRAKVASLGLPAGKQKRRTTEEDEIDDLIEQFTSIFGADARGGMGDFRTFRASPEMIEQILGGKRVSQSRTRGFGGMSDFAE